MDRMKLKKITVLESGEIDFCFEGSIPLIYDGKKLKIKKD